MIWHIDKQILHIYRSEMPYSIFTILLKKIVIFFAIDIQKKDSTRLILSFNKQNIPTYRQNEQLFSVLYPIKLIFYSIEQYPMNLNVYQYESSFVHFRDHHLLHTQQSDLVDIMYMLNHVKTKHVDVVLFDQLLLYHHY
jgi:hypothetical protein